MRIALCGALGKMGKAVYEYCRRDSDVDVILAADKLFDSGTLSKETPSERHCADADYNVDTANADRTNMRFGRDVQTVCDISDAQCDFDAIIDFSAHNATISILKVAIVRRCAVVLATTGHDDEEKKYIEYASRFIPIFYSGNMSLGIAAMARCVKETLTLFKKADVEIVETHHVEKLDAPSGTALMLADVVKQTVGGRIVVSRCGYGAKEDGDIGVHSLRMGNVFGQHEVRINTGDEVLEFKHEALSRNVYARGAIEAVKFLENKGAGLYGMTDLLCRN